ncbi:PfkB family carbohydrate kinase [Curtobacterium sp. UCD-KPL2560]|uniref:PfkB family carbohydrate kinase n=1 Tax=Curtobacterium sp. UCD-KPL2560 TaxID=1885315 RepID=UPI0008259EB7|nr:PfkB family carbohydrate kinase [Curtobacterium sp. UCD-KPL2560]
MSSAPGTVVVVGSVNVDQVVTVTRHPRPGETLIGTGVEQLPGGKGANQAVAAARRGATTAIVGSVGRDAAADVATSLLAGSGVDLTHLRAVDAPTGFAAVTVGADGENTIVVVPGANLATGAAAVAAAAPVVAGASVVVLQGEIPADGITAAAAAATGRVVLNLAPVVPVPRDVVLAADPLVVNEHEAALVLAQLDGDDPGQAQMGAAETDLVRSLLAHGVRSVVVTLGARGALVGGAHGAGDDLLTVPSPRVHAVDSSGAGDAFVGALAASLAAGTTLAAAVHHAVRVGAYAVQRVGTQPSYPTLDDTLPGAVATDPTRGTT